MVVCLLLIILFRCTVIPMVIRNTELPYTKCNRWQVTCLTSCMEDAAFRTQLSLSCSGGWQKSLSEEQNVHLWNTEWGALSTCSRHWMLSGDCTLPQRLFWTQNLRYFPHMLAMTVKIEIPNTCLATFFSLGLFWSLQQCGLQHSCSNHCQHSWGKGHFTQRTQSS